LVIFLSSCCQHDKIISELDTTKCAIKNSELLAWIYKNRFENEKLNDFPNNKVSSIVFVDYSGQCVQLLWSIVYNPERD